MYWLRACAYGWGSTLELFEKEGEEEGSGGGDLVGGGVTEGGGVSLSCAPGFNVKHGAGAARDNGGAEGKKAAWSSESVHGG